MKFRRTPTAPALPENEELVKIRARLHDVLDGPLADASILAGVDQLTGAMRRRFTECGVDLDDATARAALLVISDTLTQSLGPLAAICTTSVRMWGIAAQLSAAVLVIDTHEQGARP